MFVFLSLLAILIYGGITYAIFWVIRRIGFTKVAKGIVFLSVAFFTYLLAVTLFEDQLFSKRDAKNLLNDQEIILNDDFQIVSNKSMWSPGDYYHTFTLKISNTDKERITREIRNAASINNLGQNVDITQLTDRYNGKKVMANYETKTVLVRKFFEPNGEGIAPTYRIVTISKKDNMLIFEDIDE
jgi:hypothetical protein